MIERRREIHDCVYLCVCVRVRVFVCVETYLVFYDLLFLRYMCVLCYLCLYFIFGPLKPMADELGSGICPIPCPSPHPSWALA